MISRYSETNKFGGYTWKININQIFHLFVHSSNDSSFVVDFKEWRWLGYKVRFSIVSSLSLEETIENSFNKIQIYFNSKNEFLWSDEQKRNKLKELFESINASSDTITKSLLFKKIKTDDKENNKVEIPQEEFQLEVSSIEKYKYLAFTSFINKDYYNSHVFAELFLEANLYDTDVNLLNLNALIRIEGKPMYQQEKFKARSMELSTFIRENYKSGLISMNEQQQEKYKEVRKEWGDFWDYWPLKYKSNNFY
jgi:hypothetical protein